MTNEVIEGNEWAAYGALDTYSQDETRDRLPHGLEGDGWKRICKDTSPAVYPTALPPLKEKPIVSERGMYERIIHASLPLKI